MEEVFRNVEGLIHHQAKKLCRNDSLLEDLLQEGRAAVMEAAEKFDSGRGTLFTTYALPLIRAAMVECGFPGIPALVTLCSAPKDRKGCFG